MTFEEKLKRYKTATQIPAREEAIQKTIQMSKAAFYANEQDKIMPYHEFLFAQFKMIQNRWWGFHGGDSIAVYYSFNSRVMEKQKLPVYGN